MKKGKLTVLMAAAECRGIAKVGGLGDVVLDLSLKLKEKGHEVFVVMPYYQSLGLKSDVHLDYLVRFAAGSMQTRLRTTEIDGLTVFLIENAFFEDEWGDVYVDSGKRGKGPFEDDAQRFAFFSAAILELVRHHQPFSKVDLIHCHDWHTGHLPLMIKLEGLESKIKTLFTIHNLDYQGVRPFDEPYAPLASYSQWFPSYFATLQNNPIKELLVDPRAKNCFNPMRAGITLANGVNTVSPTYAQEITQSDDEEANFMGGRGLEVDLQQRLQEKRLWGILNGLDYETFDPQKFSPPYSADSADLASVKRAHKNTFLQELPQKVKALAVQHGARFKNSPKVISHVDSFLKASKDKPLVVCVTRAVSQKMGLFLDRMTETATVFDQFLKKDLALIVIGTGELEDKLEALNNKKNALFLCAFDSHFALDLYRCGDLFLMPSDFEPCGISQLMAMRYGCLPIVHDRGGLHDTVVDQQTGFVFSGKNRSDARSSFLKTVDRALKVVGDESSWVDRMRQAMKQRFDWTASVQVYEKTYRFLCEQS